MLDKKVNKGITLIALVITIGLMIILAGVTVNVALNGDLFETAGNAKHTAENASERIAIQKAVIIARENSKTGRITAEEMQKALNKVMNEGTATAINNGETIVVKFEQSEIYYNVETDVKSNGKIETFTPYEDTTPGVLAQNSDGVYMVESIEDLVVLSAMASGGYSDDNVEIGYLSSDGTHSVVLMRDLDFKSALSYNDYTTTIYNGYLGIEDEKVTLMEALTNIEEYKGFIPIGNLSRSFSMAFDGNNHQIRNLYENTEDYAGLFGYISHGLRVNDLTVTGEINSTTTYAGGIVGGAGGEITNCVNYAKVSGASAGGVCGEILSSITFNGCVNYGDVYASNDGGGIAAYSIAASGNFEFNYCINNGYVSGVSVGGIMGRKHSASVTFNSCLNSTEGEVEASGEANYAGGIIGRKSNSVNFYIYNCANLGKVSGNDAGGMLGRPSWWAYDILANCFGGGKITGNGAGGLIGYAPGGDTGYNCYYLLSDSISNSIGSSSGSIDSTALTEVNEDIINSLNDYIEENTDEIDTTGWAKWVLNKNSEPTLDFTTTWDGTEWVTEE